MTRRGWILGTGLCGCGARRSSAAVRVITYPVLDFFPIYLAIELGLLRAEGVEVALEELTQGTKIMEALVAGSADVSTDGLLYAELMRAQGLRLKTFFNNYTNALALVVAGPSRAGDIADVAGLKGALVGIASYGGLHHRMLSFYLHRAGLKESDVRLTAIGMAATAVAALKHGKVDAAVINGASFRLLKKQVPGIRVLVDPRSREQAKALFGVEEFPGGLGLLATEKWLDQNPTKARRLARAMRRTLDWIHAHPAEEVLEGIPAHLRSDDREADLEHVRLIGLLSKDGRIPPGGPEAVQRVLAVSMDRAMSIDLASTWTNEFVEEAKENP